MGWDYADCTVEASDDDHKKIKGDVSLIWIHRIELAEKYGQNTAAGISHAFQTVPELVRVTGGNMPYHWIGTPDRIEQALALEEKGAHARRWGNMFGWGFANVGNFHEREPSVYVWERAVDLCAMMVPGLDEHTPRMLAKLPEHLRHELPIVGHGEVPIAYDPKHGKEQPNGSDACPGRYWNMDEFRDDVRALMKEKAGNEALVKGVKFSIT